MKSFITRTLSFGLGVAAVLLLRPGRSVAEHARWTIVHLGILCVALLIGFMLVELTFDAGVVQQSERMHFETNVLAKLAWFFKQPLPNALALFALRDKFNTGAPFFWAAAASSVAVISFGWRFGPAAWSNRVRWLVCAVAFPFVAHGISLASSAWVNGYRTLFALAGLVVVLLVFGLRSLRTSERITLRVQACKNSARAVPDEIEARGRETRLSLQSNRLVTFQENLGFIRAY